VRNPGACHSNFSDEQVARYGRFPEEPSTAELEQFFGLDRAALNALTDKGCRVGSDRGALS
jgi:hypothetical protein